MDAATVGPMRASIRRGRGEAFRRPQHGRLPFDAPHQSGHYALVVGLAYLQPQHHAYARHKVVEPTCSFFAS